MLKAAGFLANDALSRGASIAFYAATSLAPVLLIVVAIAGLAFFSQIRSRAASLGLVAALGFMPIVSLAASTGLSALEHWSAGKVVLGALNTVVSLAIFTLLFSEIYRVLPDATISWRHLVLGIFVTALLFVVGKSLIGCTSVARRRVRSTARRVR